MSVNRFWLNDIEDALRSVVDVVVVGAGADDRSAELPRRWEGTFRGSVRCLPYDVRNERCGWAEVGCGDQQSRKNCLPDMDIADLYNVLLDAELQHKTVLVDFTGMEQPAILFLLKCLSEQKQVRRVFGAYTEPLRYRTANRGDTREDFDLTEEFIEFQAVPGFVRPHQRDRKSQVVVYMGFEGRRFVKVLEEVNPEPGNTHAVYGIPAFQPGWQYLTLGCNQAALEQSHAILHRAEAADVFDAFDVAADVAESNRDLQVVLAPIGTKPHAVGAALYVIRHEEALLVYDFPIKQRMFRTEGVGRTYIYNMTEYLVK